MNKEKEMDIPYIDYAQHVEALVGVGIPQGNIYDNWSDVDVQNLQKKFDFYQGFLDSGRKHSKENSYFYFSEDYRLSGGVRKMRGDCLNYDLQRLYDGL